MTKHSKPQIMPVADLYEMQFKDGHTMTWSYDADKALQWLSMRNGNKVIEYVKLTRLQEAVAGNSPLTPELKPANLINKFYERYPLSEFKNDGERASALGYFMAGAELQCFDEFIKYEDLCSDE